MAEPISFNLADLWETVARAVPDRTALVCGDRRASYAALDSRADRLAVWMARRGVSPGDRVGIVAHNGPEHVEAILAAFKLRAAPVSVNFRYLDAELRHVFADAGLVGIVYDAELGDRVATAAAGLPHVGWLLPIGAPYEAALGEPSGQLPRGPRSGDDPYVLYTGGTTGPPKGVVWRSEDAFFACIGGGDPTGTRGPISRPEVLVERIVSEFSFVPIAPLMHAAGTWTVMRWLLAGGKVSLLAEFDPASVWDVIDRERVNQINIVGDAIARPLLEELERAPGRWDVSSLATIASGGAVMTPTTKQRFTAALPGVVIKDTYGSSETGVQGMSRHEGGVGVTVTFEVHDTVVLDELTGEPVAPGAVGRVARRGRVPLGYHGDPERTAATFPIIDGVRHAVTGDLGRFDEQGRLHLLGRGSQCINTGGEKVFPEEVETVLLDHPAIADVVVVGAPHERWGQEVVAVVAPAPDAVVSLKDVQMHCRVRLAGFKLPRRLVEVPRIERTTAGKADYRWAVKIVQSQEGDR